MHARAVEVAEPRGFLFGLAFDEIDGRGQEFLVDGFHPLGVQRAGVLDDLLAHLAELLINSLVVHVGGRAPEHAARPEALAESRILRIVGGLRGLLGVEVIQVAEELVEPVHSR